VTPADRAKAKTTVYGLLYGQGEAGLAHKLGVSREEAGDITRALYAAFPSLRKVRSRDAFEARRARGAFLPLAARLRPLPGFGSADASARAEAERRAVNTLVQGTAADLMKLAMERWCRVVSAEEKEEPSSGKKKRAVPRGAPGLRRVARVSGGADPR
jgi:DNA polymerase-1